MAKKRNAQSGLPSDQPLDEYESVNYLAQLTDQEVLALPSPIVNFFRKDVLFVVDVHPTLDAAADPRELHRLAFEIDAFLSRHYDLLIAQHEGKPNGDEQ